MSHFFVNILIHLFLTIIYFIYKNKTGLSTSKNSQILFDDYEGSEFEYNVSKSEKDIEGHKKSNKK